ncbi:MAG: M56 family metallopeptidase [Bacteroidota bacterium]
MVDVLFDAAWAQALAAWLATYALHSTLLFGAVWLASRWITSALALDALWKTAVLAGVVTTSVQMSVQPAVYTASSPSESTLVVLRGQDAGHLLGLNAGQIVVQERGAVAPLVIERTPRPKLQSEPVASSSGWVPVPLRPSWRLPATGALWIAALVGFWLLGVVVEGLRRVRAHRQFIARIARRTPVASPALVADLNELGRSAGLRYPLRLTQTPTVAVPVALGVDEVVLPTWVVEEATASQQRAMMAHEVAHLTRRDPFWLAVFAVIESVLFFQPLNHLARRRQQAAAERLCDAWAAEQASPLIMARCLVEAASHLRAHGNSATLPHLVPGMANGGSLSERVECLVDATNEARRRWPALLVVASVVSLVLVAAPSVTSAAQPARAQSVVPGPSTSASPDSTVRAQLEQHMLGVQAKLAAYEAEMNAYMETLVRATNLLQAEFGPLQAAHADSAPASESAPSLDAIRSELSEAETELRALDRDLRTLAYVSGQDRAVRSTEVRIQIERLVERLQRVAPHVEISALQPDALAWPPHTQDQADELEREAQRLTHLSERFGREAEGDERP